MNSYDTYGYLRLATASAAKGRSRYDLNRVFPQFNTSLTEYGKGDIPLCSEDRSLTVTALNEL